MRKNKNTGSEVKKYPERKGKCSASKQNRRCLHISREEWKWI